MEPGEFDFWNYRYYAGSYIDWRSGWSNPQPFLYPASRYVLSGGIALVTVPRSRYRFQSEVRMFWNGAYVRQYYRISAFNVQVTITNFRFTEILTKFDFWTDDYGYLYTASRAMAAVNMSLPADVAKWVGFQLKAPTNYYAYGSNGRWMTIGTWRYLMAWGGWL